MSESVRLTLDEVRALATGTFLANGGSARPVAGADVVRALRSYRNCQSCAPASPSDQNAVPVRGVPASTAS